jgi:hypothetical protein
LIRSRRASLHVAHCRFLCKGESTALLVTCPADVTARNCEFEGDPDASSAFGFTEAGRSKVRIEQCVLWGRALSIDFTEPPEDMSVTLVHNTAHVTGPFLVVSPGPSKAGPAATSKSPIRLHASGNIVYGEPPFLRVPARGRVIEAADAERLPRGLVRLDPGMLGKGAGSGGTDLGADLRLVGPGEPYQCWTKTPEYQEWRKSTNALMQAHGAQQTASGDHGA